MELLLKLLNRLLGPVITAGANLLMAMAVMRSNTAHEYGAFSFSLMLIQLGFGVSNAMSGTPLVLLLNGEAKLTERDEVGALYDVNTIISVLWSVIVFASAIFVLGERPETFLLLSASLFGMLRWFGRSASIASGSPGRVHMSDICYGAVIALPALYGLVSGNLKLGFAIFIVTIGSLIGLLPFGIGYLKRSFRLRFDRVGSNYLPIWKRQSSWNLFGVASSEAAGNAHSYLVTAFAGASGFAPIALASLLWRPVMLAITSFTQFERPAIARAVAVGDDLVARRITFHFQIALFAATIGNLVAAAVVILFFYDKLSKGKYSQGAAIAVCCAWFLIMLARSWREPLGVLAQCRGQFKHLAMLTGVAAVLGIASCAGLLLVGGATAAIFGIFVGELFLAVALTLRLSRVKSRVA